MTELSKKPAAIRTVLPFVFQHWLQQPWRRSASSPACSGRPWPKFSGRVAGHLVDAVTRAHPMLRRATPRSSLRRDRRAGRGLDRVAPERTQVIVPFTLKMMADIAGRLPSRPAFSTDWHANSFAGSTVRKVTRGMWALDLLNDTILIALLPSLVMLVGSMILLGVLWP